MSHAQEPSSSSSQNERINFPQDGDGEVAHGSVVSESNSNIEKGPMDPVRKDIASLKSFQKTVTKKLYELGKALIICQQTNPNSSIDPPRWNSSCHVEGAYPPRSSNQCINKWS